MGCGHERALSHDVDKRPAVRGPRCLESFVGWAYRRSGKASSRSTSVIRQILLAWRIAAVAEAHVHASAG